MRYRLLLSSVLALGVLGLAACADESITQPDKQPPVLKAQKPVPRKETRSWSPFCVTFHEYRSCMSAKVTTATSGRKTVTFAVQNLDGSLAVDGFLSPRPFTISSVGLQGRTDRYYGTTLASVLQVQTVGLVGVQGDPYHNWVASLPVSSPYLDVGGGKIEGCAPAPLPSASFSTCPSTGLTGSVVFTVATTSVNWSLAESRLRVGGYFDTDNPNYSSVGFHCIDGDPPGDLTCAVVQ
jgi:hypothetical protein